MVFFITGTLYEKNEKSLETINNTFFLYERKEIKANKTFIIYNNIFRNSSNWTLVFRNFSRDNNYIYDLRLQIIVSTFNDNSKEGFLAISKEVDLTGIKPNKEESKKGTPWYAWGIPVIVVGFILIIIIIIYFVIKFLRLKKTNTNLKNEMLSLSFLNDIQKNVLIKDMKLSKNDSDYESTFI